MSKTMKAVQKTKPGVGCEIVNIPVPEIGAGDLLVRVKATAICKSDEEVWAWSPLVEAANLPMPWIMGHEYCGEIVEMGAMVEGFSVGDVVAGETHIACGVCKTCRTGNQHICGNNMGVLGRNVDGSFAEYIRMPAKSAVLLPKTFDPKHGAILEPFGVAVHAVTEAEVSGKAVLIVGAGTIGAMAVEVAKLLGAVKVIAADIVQSKLDECLKHGADYVINSREKNLAEEVLKLTNGYGVESVIDFTGNNRVINAEIDAVAIAGRLRIIGMVETQLIIDNFMYRCAYRQIDIKGLFGRRMFETWELILDIIETGRIDFSRFVGQVRPIDEINDAMEHFAEVNGRIVLIP